MLELEIRVGRNKSLWTQLRHGVLDVICLFDEAIVFERGCRNRASARYGLLAIRVRLRLTVKRCTAKIHSINGSTG